METLQPNIDWTKRKLMENKDAFLESNLNFIHGQSSKVRSFASKGLASLAAVEVSTAFRNEIVNQSKILCEDYIYNRLARVLHNQQRRYFFRDIKRSANESQTSDSSTLSRQMSACRPFEKPQLDAVSNDQTEGENSPSSETVFANSSPDKVGQVMYEKWRNRLPEVSARIQELGSKLEETYPHLYDGLSSQLKMPLRSEAAINKALTCIGDFMFKNGTITWYRIIGLYAVAGAMALECIDHEQGNMIRPIVTIFAQVVDRHIALWVCHQGGWAALVQKYERMTEKYKTLVLMVGLCLGFIVMISIPISFI